MYKKYGNFVHKPFINTCTCFFLVFRYIPNQTYEKIQEFPITFKNYLFIDYIYNLCLFLVFFGMKKSLSKTLKLNVALSILIVLVFVVSSFFTLCMVLLSICCQKLFYLEKLNYRQVMGLFKYFGKINLKFTYFFDRKLQTIP